jgi:CheY-like chemotaxis protein
MDQRRDGILIKARLGARSNDETDLCPRMPTTATQLPTYAATAPRSLRPLRCLIIDDNLEFLEAAIRLLRQEGVAVVGAALNGEEGFRLASEVHPEVTLIDIDLGADDGIAVARQLAGVEGRPAGKIILISTHAEDEFIDLIETSPAIGFVPKSELSAAAIDDLASAGAEQTAQGWARGRRP